MCSTYRSVVRRIPYPHLRMCACVCGRGTPYLIKRRHFLAVQHRLRRRRRKEFYTRSSRRVSCVIRELTVYECSPAASPRLWSFTIAQTASVALVSPGMCYYYNRRNLLGDHSSASVLCRSIQSACPRDGWISSGTPSRRGETAGVVRTIHI